MSKSSGVVSNTLPNACQAFRAQGLGFKVCLQDFGGKRLPSVSVSYTARAATQERQSIGGIDCRTQSKLPGFGAYWGETMHIMGHAVHTAPIYACGHAVHTAPIYVQCILRQSTCSAYCANLRAYMQCILRQSTCSAYCANLRVYMQCILRQSTTCSAYCANLRAPRLWQHANQPLAACESAFGSMRISLWQHANQPLAACESKAAYEACGSKGSYEACESCESKAA